jgi:hypothetical protein
MKALISRGDERAVDNIRGLQRRLRASRRDPANECGG